MTQSKLYQLIFIYLLLSAIPSWAQKSEIRGKIIDDENAEELIGATALIEGTSIGAAADLDGNYNIKNVEPGTYTVVFTFVSYQTQKVSGVVVKPGIVTVLNMRLKPESVGLAEVVIEAKRIENTEAALLTIQKNQPLL